MTKRDTVTLTHPPRKAGPHLPSHHDSAWRATQGTWWACPARPANPEPAQWIRGEATVGDLMNPTSSRFTPMIQRHRRLEMARRAIHRIIVLDDEQAAGIVTPMDVVCASRRKRLTWAPEWQTLPLPSPASRGEGVKSVRCGGRGPGSSVTQSRCPGLPSAPPRPLRAALAAIRGRDVTENLFDVTSTADGWGARIPCT
jgi:hypothetical protein